MQEGFALMIYTSDHQPAHVHVFRAEGLMKRVTNAEIKRATEAQQLADATEPRASSVHYDRLTRRLVLDLTDGVSIAIPVTKLQGLAGASEPEIENVKLIHGEHLHWDALDVQFTVPHLVAGIFGTKTWMQDVWKKAGRAKSEAKTAAARANGAKGGRPRKLVAA
jgi:hypothetical protein